MDFDKGKGHAYEFVLVSLATWEELDVKILLNQSQNETRRPAMASQGATMWIPPSPENAVRRVCHTPSPTATPAFSSSVAALPTPMTVWL